MTKKEIVNDLNHLLELCKDGLIHEALNADYSNEQGIGYMHGYADAMEAHIENIKTLLDKVKG